MAKRRRKRPGLSNNAGSVSDASRQSTALRSPLRRWWAFTSFAVALAVAASASLLYRHNRPHPGPNDGSASQYVDSNVCMQCHLGIANSYSKTGMGHSIYPATAENVIEDYRDKNKVYHAASANYYTMVQSDGKFYQRRHQIGFNGSVANVAEEQVDYVIGSGDQARSYLHRTSEGKLIELPVSWYAEKGGSWQMSPGYDHADQKDFNAAISYDCMFCHSGYPARARDKQIVESGEPIFPLEPPRGIDCQRCHGPGRAHVLAARARHPSIEAISQSIVNPARLDRNRQLEVCMECHLSTSGSQGSNVSLRFNRDIFSYIPGQPLGDYKLYFDSEDTPAKKDGFEIADAAYRLRLSSCFRNSQMTCITCHDPHEQAHGREAEAHYLETCQSCHKAVVHRAALPATETCISCHLPKRRGEYATHIVLIDHYIQKQRPLRDLLAPLVESNSATSPTALALYYPETLPPTPQNRLYLAVSKVESGVDSAASIDHLQSLVQQVKPGAAGFYESLGRAYMRGGNEEAAIPWLQQALDRAPNRHSTIDEMAEALLATGQLERARQLLEKATSQPPADSALLANLGNAYARLGRLDNAEDVLRRALAVNPEIAQTNNLLGQVKFRKDDATAAEHFYRESIRIQPNLGEAHVNLSELLTGTDRMSEAEFEIKRAISLEPEDARAHHVYGMLLFLMKKNANAEAELRQSLHLNASDARVHADLADILAESGSFQEASVEYRLALKQDPGMPEANAGMAQILLKEGRKAEAVPFCEKIVQTSDPDIQNLARNCLEP
jgi:Flp pilus assembly protein TadD